MVPKEPPRYRSFLLRIWKEQDQGAEMSRRFSLESPRTGERHGFGSIEALVHFLEEEEET